MDCDVENSAAPSCTTWEQMQATLLDTLSVQQLEHQLRVERMLRCHNLRIIKYLKHCCLKTASGDYCSETGFGVSANDSTLTPTSLFSDLSPANQWMRDEGGGSRTTFFSPSSRASESMNGQDVQASSLTELPRGPLDAASRGSCQLIANFDPPQTQSKVGSRGAERLPSDTAKNSQSEPLEKDAEASHARYETHMPVIEENAEEPVKKTDSTSRKVFFKECSSSSFICTDDSSADSEVGQVRPSTVSLASRPTRVTRVEPGKQSTRSGRATVSGRDSRTYAYQHAKKKGRLSGMQASVMNVAGPAFGQDLFDKSRNLMNRLGLHKKSTGSAALTEAQDQKYQLLAEALGAIELGDVEFLSTLVEVHASTMICEIGSILVKGVARTGNIEMLEMLKEKQLWQLGTAEGTKSVIEGAVIGGQLPALLQYYTLPLDKFPHIARDFVFLLRKYPQLRASVLEQPRLQFLLASFITVPGQAAEELLDMVTEEFLAINVKEDGSERQLDDLNNSLSVTDSDRLHAAKAIALAKTKDLALPKTNSKTLDLGKQSSQSKLWKVKKQNSKDKIKASGSLIWVPIKKDFPNCLSPIYIRPEVTECAIEQCATYDAEEQKVHLMLRDRTCELDTSSEADVSAQDWDDTHVPSRAVRFAYIYGTADFPVGGFLYLDSGGHLLAISSLSFNRRRHALWFDNYHLLDTATSNALRLQSYPCSQGTPIWKAGAKRYCFVPPDTLITERNSMKTFCTGSQGGFAYFFEDETSDRFFPIAGVGETIDRASVSKFGLNATCLSCDPTGEELLKSIVRLDRGSKSLPVMMRRLIVPGTTHIVVLHALATTTRLQVLETLAARAIIDAAWAKIKFRYFRDLAIEMLRIGAIWYVTVKVRAYVDPKKSDIMDVGATSPTFQHMHPSGQLLLCYFFLIVLWVRSVWQESLKALAFHKLNWEDDYFDSRFLIEWIDVGIMGSFLWLQGFSSASASVILPLLALHGFWRWMKILDFLRCYDGVGSRVLPIIAALREILPFGSVLMFFIFGFVHAFYAISHKNVLYVFLSTYRMGILGDMDIGIDIFGVDDADERSSAVHGTLLDHKLPWSGWQCAIFVFSSMVFTVAMMNIFIGIMSQSYHENTRKAYTLFLRARAAMIVTYTVRRWRFNRKIKKMAAVSETEFVWFCHVEEGANEI